MTYDFTPKPVAVPKDKPNNQTALQLKFAMDELSGAVKKSSPNRAVRLGEILQTGLFELNSSGVLVPKSTVDETAAALGLDRCINGRFKNWQRSVSGVFSGGSTQRYVADRWVSSVVALNVVVSPVALTGADVAKFGRSAHRTNISSATAANPSAFAGQKIEGVDSLIGRLVVDAGIRCTSGSRKVGVRVVMNYGTGGSAQESFELPKVVTVTATMQAYQWQFELPSLAGKTIGKGSYIWVIFDYCGTGYGGEQSGQTGVFDLADVHFSVASAEAVVQLPDALELVLCQRYYEKSYDVDVLPGTITPNGQGAFFIYGLPTNTYSAGKDIPFKVSKRAAPTMTGYSPQSGAAGVAFSAAPAADIPVAFQDTGVAGTFVTLGPPPSGTINLNYRYHWTADSEL